MSFAVDLEAQRDVSPQETENGETEIGLIITKTSNLLTDFANGVNSLDRQIQQLGTKRDSLQLRKSIKDIKLVELTDYKTQLEHLINDISHLISSNTHASSEDKFTEEKLRKEFETLKKNFNQLKRRFQEKESSTLLNDKINKSATFQEETSGTPPDEHTPLMQQQNQQQQQQQYLISQQELDLHTVMAEERANEIKKIHGGVEEINSIYKQLGFLVQQQGQQVDTVENNMTSLVNNTHNASRELVKADNYQKSRRKWSCIILIFLVVFTLVVVLGIFA